MKKCPFCAEEIQAAAIKCKHCGEFLDLSKNPPWKEAKTEWYFRKTFIVLAFCAVGPIALPLIWWHPTMKRTWKIGLTIGILAVSWVLFRLTMDSVHRLMEYYQLIQEL